MTQTSMFRGVRPPGESHANRGMEFEKELQWQHAVYERQGIAKMDKQYVPSLPVKDGKWAKVIGKAVVDFSGEMAGGQHVAFDAKDCAGKRIELDRLKPHQMEHLEGVERLGGVGFVLVRFERRRAYRIPVRRGGRRLRRTGGLRASMTRSSAGRRPGRPASAWATSRRSGEWMEWTG